MDKSPYIPPKDWTSEQVQAKLEDLINHVERLKDDWWDEDLKGLINVHGVFSPELARAALEKEVYRPSEIYYRLIRCVAEEYPDEPDWMRALRVKLRWTIRLLESEATG